MQSIIRIIVNYVFFAFFILCTFRNSLRFSFGISLLLAIIPAICGAGVVSFFVFGDRELSLANSYVIIVWFLCVISIIQIVIKKRFFQLFYMVLMGINLYHNTSLLSLILAKYFFPADTTETSITLTNFLLLALHTPLLWILLVKLYRKILESKTNLRFWQFAWILPLLTYLIYVVRILPEYAPHDYRISFSDIIFALLWNAIIYLIFFIILNMIVQMLKSFQAEKKTQMASRQLELQKELYKRLTENYEKTARLRHDFHHHLLAIKTYIQEENIGALNNYLNKYLAEFTASVNDEETSPLCSNLMINNILRYYSLLAKKNGITYEVALHLPDNLNIPEMDLCVIFGNLVENAIEACLRQTTEEKFIRIQAAIKEQQLFVCISNSFSGVINQKDDVFYSAKRGDHGLGILSVSEIVAKNGGSITITHESGIFKVYIYLCLG